MFEVKLEKPIAPKLSPERIFHYDLGFTAKAASLIEMLFAGGAPPLYRMELGSYRLKGMGVARINFIRPFEKMVVFNHTEIGYIEIPLIGLKIPPLLIVLGVDNSGVDILHVCSETLFNFMVVGV